MGRRAKGPLFVENIQIIDAGAKGKGVGKTEDGRVVFVQNAVPGDKVDVRVFKKKRSFMEGKATVFHELSSDRVEPECKHFGTCGGCKWQNWDYNKQLEYKQKEVANNLKRLGHVEVEEYLDILGCDQPYFYRNKMEFSFSNKRWITQEEVDSGVEINKPNALGFHIPGMWDKVLNITKCHLQPDPSNQIRNFVRDYALEHDLDFFDLRNQEGLLRTLMIRTALSGEVMVLIQFFREEAEKREGLMNALKAEFPQIASLLYTINSKGNDSIYDCDIELFDGRDHIFEEMPAYYKPDTKLRFKIGPKSFYQTNPNQAYSLYVQALEFAELKGDELVYDLYTGTGTIACFLAQKAGKVIGIESVPEAIQDAKFNAELNGLSNTEFIVGDMKEALTADFADIHGMPDVVVTDPPRDGMHAKVVEQLLNMAPKRIVYVSCNSATQARDLGLLQEKYRIVKSRAVDMFPQTHHIENVAVLELK
ncbi:MAG: 23S rRNA (uracil(1939)-C(5))-methyltransferase RlmD [Flavobacteriia bacterium]|nr:23S rRNA (uracil(1939)-C(5))-methyltransferase RlmD [Flavobacteriia bacterium]